jgi:alpha-glucosidase
MRETESPPDFNGKVGYSILTPTFHDSNGDGIGDIPGVTEKLDYLQHLGIGIVHLTPFYPTHLYDIGYDVDDYENIDPRYGDLESCKNFIDASHERGIKVVTDMVINHTSIHHSWFKQSRSSRDNPKRDWYIWRDRKPDGTLPNNWAANFGGDAWELDEKTGQYYLHTFLPEQPDLNYENPEVREEMIAIMKRWTKLGVDGFRLDSINFIRKAEGLPNAIPNDTYVPGISHPNSRVKNDEWWYQPEMLDELRSFTEATGAFIFSESNPPESHKEWREKIYRAARPDNHAMINSTLNGMSWNAETVLGHLEEFYGMLQPGNIASFQTSCHDVYQRTADRIGEAQARNAALLNLTLPGIPWLYYGDEIGMHGQEVPYDLNNAFQNLTFIRFGYDRTKNPSRLSMAWDSSENAGFTTGNPVLPVPKDFRTHNVAVESSVPGSMLDFHQNLIRHRKTSPALREGTFHRLDSHNNEVGAYACKTENGQNEAVVINFSNEEQKISLDIQAAVPLIVTKSNNQPGYTIDLRNYTLRPNEGMLLTRNK